MQLDRDAPPGPNKFFIIEGTPEQIEHVKKLMYDRVGVCRCCCDGHGPTPDVAVLFGLFADRATHTHTHTHTHTQGPMGPPGFAPFGGPAGWYVAVPPPHLSCVPLGVPGLVCLVRLWRSANL